MISELLKKGLEAIENKPKAVKKEIIPPSIDPEKCTDCGLCHNICFVIEKRGDKPAVTNPEYCIGCGHCGAFCPSKAITNSASEPKRLTAKDKKTLPSSESLQFLLRSRRSIRIYKKKPINRADMARILEAGRYTATGSNSQNVRYIIYSDREKISRLQKEMAPVLFRLFRLSQIVTGMPLAKRYIGKDYVKKVREFYKPALSVFEEKVRQGRERIFYNAPALIIVYAEKFDEAAGFGCAAALYNCSLMAHLLGVGCCFNGFVQLAANHNKKIRKVLGIPRHMQCYGAMTLGYQKMKFKRLVKRNPPNVTWI